MPGAVLITNRKQRSKFPGEEGKNEQGELDGGSKKVKTRRRKSRIKEKKKSEIGTRKLRGSDSDCR